MSIEEPEMSLVAVDSSTATADQLEAQAVVRESWGHVPNLGAVLALSLPLTRAVVAFDTSLSRGAFSGGVAEQLAIAVSQENRCAYCLAAHSAAARAAGMSADDVAAAPSAHASDPKTAAALRFAQQVIRTRGQVDERDLADVRSAGWQDTEIVEIVGHALSTTLSNYLHHLSGVPIDYPAVGFAEDDARA
jgi:uncharacterized peroxidase-related enzyme